MKTCYLCLKNKEYENFHKDKSRSDNYSNKCKLCWKEYRDNNKEKASNYQRINWYKYKGIYKKDKEYHRKYVKERRKSDLMFKLQGTLRNRIYIMFKFKDWKKNKHTEEILGASYKDTKKHIESTFEEKMNWENHGDWHIDHKIPLNLAKTEEELYKLCHYTNLQALWAFDNISKSNKI